MRGFLLGAAYLAVAILSGSLLAWAVHDLLPYTHEKVLSRSVLLFAALGLVPLWRLLGLNRETIGLVGFRGAEMVRSFLVGLLVIAPVVLFFWVVGYRMLVPEDQLAEINIAATIGIVFGSAVLVGLFEEVLFRGVVLAAIEIRWGFWAAAGGSSFVYALVHFLDVDMVLAPSWYAGFVYLGQSMASLAQPAGYWDSFVSLFLLGILFCVVRSKLSLWWCIGFHAAWVFAIRIQSAVTDRDPVNPFLPIISDYDHFVGHLVSGWLLFLLVVMHLNELRRSNSTGPPASVTQRLWVRGER